MTVLFVSSGNNKNFEVIPFIKEQGEALKKLGLSVDYYPIVGKGLLGYLKAGLRLRKHLKYKQYDLIHAHYTFSAWSAIIAARNIPVVLSLMGGDAYGTYVGVDKVLLSSRFSTLLTWLAQPFVKAIISKSENIERYVYLKRKSHLIPNGIDTQKFKPQLNGHTKPFASNKRKQVLFLGNKENIRKNFSLADAAVRRLHKPDVELLNPYPVGHDAIPDLLNTVDVLVVPSLMEGSPNVVKEAMACNCPVVAADTGDIRWVLGNTDGCYLAGYDPGDFSAKLQQALDYATTKGRTNGVERIKALGLDAETVANKIKEVYEKVLHNHKR